MRSYYQPQIFNNMLESVNLKEHFVATYYIRNRKEGAVLLDHMNFFEKLALESSTGTWEKIKDDTSEIKEMLSCKLVGYFEIPNDDPYTAECVVQFAMSSKAFVDNIPMMLLSFAGNCFAYCNDLRLLDVAIPDEVVDKFPGPKFGHEGL